MPLEEMLDETVIKMRNIGCAGRPYDPKYDGPVYHVNEEAEIKLRAVLIEFAARVQVETVSELAATQAGPVIVPPPIDAQYFNANPKPFDFYDLLPKEFV